MEIRVDRNELYRAMSRVQTIIEKRSNMPILSMVLLSVNDSDICISATDLEISYQQRLPARIINTGSLTISGRKLFEILKESHSQEIYLKEKENNWVFISDGHARYNLACLPSEEYPTFVEPEGVSMIDIDGETLREMITKTIFSVTMEEAGFKLSGVYTEKIQREGEPLLRMVSTDGHRLSMIDKSVVHLDRLEIDQGVMIPKKGLSELNKLATEEGGLQLGFKGNNCVAKREDTVIVIRLLESKFPDYNAVIPKKPKIKVRIERDTLLDGMKKMIILSNESYKGLKVTLDRNDMELMSINPDLGDAQENLKIDYDHERLEMGFNSKYFIDVLQVLESEVVELGFIDSGSPCLIQGEKDPGFFGLIMPMRI